MTETTTLFFDERGEECSADEATWAQTLVTRGRRVIRSQRIRLLKPSPQNADDQKTRTG